MPSPSSRSSSTTTTTTVKLLLFLTFFVSFATANTEIRNFHIARSSSTTTTVEVGVEVKEEYKEVGSPTPIERRLRSYLDAQTLNATFNERTFRVWPGAVGTPLRLRDVCERECERERDVPYADDAIKSDGDTYTRQAMDDEKLKCVRCPNEVWLELDVSDPEWIRYDSFTIRLSWPAFHPTDFDITLYTPEELDAFIHSRILITDKQAQRPLDDKESRIRETSRIRFARIRLVDTGIRPPSKSPPHFPSSSSKTRPDGTDQNETRIGEVEPVPFTVILEPLLFGVLPATVLPTVLFLIPLLASVFCAFPYVMRYLDSVADEARKELYGVRKERKEQ